MKKLWIYITGLIMGAMMIALAGCGTGQPRSAENADSTHLDTNTTSTIGMPDSVLGSDTMNRRAGADSMN